jgi:hypothetical protein
VSSGPVAQPFAVSRQDAGTYSWTPRYDTGCHPLGGVNDAWEEPCAPRVANVTPAAIAIVATAVANAIGHRR